MKKSQTHLFEKDRPLTNVVGKIEVNVCMPLHTMWHVGGQFQVLELKSN